ncbi:MAG: SDR family oxidoreductase [Phycisphaerae bacterium]
MTNTTSGCSALLTGATGFLGHHILAELLERRWRCTVLLRHPLEGSIARLNALLAEVGIDFARYVGDGLLRPVCAELPDTLPSLELDDSPTVLIHTAAATNFRRSATGEPERTNVEGTRAVLAWATQLGLRRVHLVSSAYACGRTSESVAEVFNPRPASFHNDYEKSKWEAERLCTDWARRTGFEVTIHRPSIMVGAFQSGRATKFGGIYLSARAAELLGRMHQNGTRLHALSIPLRIKGRPLDRQNIVPVDYVARMIVAAAATEDAGGRVYHLVHPNPPSNLQIKHAFERYFDIGGGRFVSPEEFSCADLNELERSFYDVVSPIEHYFVDAPVFHREHAAALERLAGITCPVYDVAAIHRFVRFAQSASWGRRRSGGTVSAPGCAEYFESFLPVHIEKSKVARVTALSAAVGFVIDDEPDGHWVCTFDGGRLTRVDRGCYRQQEDFGYRTTRAVFWESVSGSPHPQELFLTGRAEMFGDIEQALKMSMILHSFTREFPCDQKRLALFVQRSCRRK